MAKLDIIIPQYKETEEVIRPLLNSLSMQQGIEKDDVKITIVNDASDTLLSTDFFNQYNNLDITYLIKDTNGGAGPARQYGVDNTNSEYIMYIDSDDYLCYEFALYVIISCLKDTKANVLVTDLICDYGNGNERLSGLDTFPWLHGKVFKRKFLIDNNIRFNSIRINEDSYYTKKCLILDNLFILKVPTYFHKLNDDSITRADNDELFIFNHFDDYFHSFYDVFLDLMDNESPKFDYAIIKGVFVYYMYLSSKYFFQKYGLKKYNYYMKLLKDVVAYRHDIFEKRYCELSYQFELEHKEIVKRHPKFNVTDDFVTALKVLGI